MSTQLAFRLGEALPPLSEFRKAQSDGWIWSKRLTTPGGMHLELFNYSKAAQWHRIWTPVTLIARGLIINLDTGDIEAAPLEKFFNFGEPIADGIVASPFPGPFDVLVKMDGSLGIGYRNDNTLSWATRGSFESPQAVIARMLWRNKYAQHDHLFFGKWNHLTPLAEIIHEETRVVVRYPYEDLVLIAARNRFTGKECTHAELVEIATTIGMPVVERIPGHDLDAVLRRAETLDDNHEGFVLFWPHGRLKVKGEEYKRAHRVLSGITDEYLATCWYDGTHDTWLPGLPEEFRLELEASLAKLDTRTAESVAVVEDVYAEANPSADRATFARWVQATDRRKELKPLLFARHAAGVLDGARRTASISVGDALESGKLASLVGGDKPSLLAQYAAYDQHVGAMLRGDALTAEGRVRIGRIMEKLPKVLRGSVSSALHGLQPDMVIGKLRAYVAEPAQGGAFDEVDVEAMFADAPAPGSSLSAHKKWVYSYPLPLRSFLERWRTSQEAETPTQYARALLADAVRGDLVKELLDVLRAPGCDQLAEMLVVLVDEVAHVWMQMPKAPHELLAYANEGRSPWGRPLMMAAWQSFRAKVREAYIVACKEKEPEERFSDE